MRQGAAALGAAWLSDGFEFGPAFRAKARVLGNVPAQHTSRRQNDIGKGIEQ